MTRGMEHLSCVDRQKMVLSGDEMALERCHCSLKRVFFLAEASNYLTRRFGFKLNKDLDETLQRNFLLRGTGKFAPRKCECPTPGSVQGQSELGPNQPNLVGDMITYGRTLELVDL